MLERFEAIEVQTGETASSCGDRAADGRRLLAHEASGPAGRRRHERGAREHEHPSALATAFYESVALVVLAGGGSTHWFDRGGIEEAYRHAPEEWIQVVKPVCKKAVLVNRPDTAVDMLLRAYQVAVTGRPGPVVLQLPFDIQHTLIEDTLPDPIPRLRVHPPAPDPAGVREAATLLARATRPLVVVGSGVANARAWDELLAFAERAQAPVALTATGKGAFPETHPLCLGSIGRAGTAHANEAARRADAVVVVGTHLSDIDTGGWTLFDVPGRTRLIHLDIDATELGPRLPGRRRSDVRRTAWPCRAVRRARRRRGSHNLALLDVSAFGVLWLSLGQLPG